MSDLKNSPCTPLEWVRYITKAFEADQYARYGQQESWWLLEALVQRSRTELLMQRELVLTSDQYQILHEWINAIVHDGKPIQYVLGEVPFGDCLITVRPPFLIPRPETEAFCIDLTNDIKKHIDTPLRILDLCTGTGCIALLCAHELTNATVCGVDIDPNAVILARENAVKNNIQTVEFIGGDLYDTVSATVRYDLIIANPPYITTSEWNQLDPWVKDWESYQALVADDEGLAVIKKIIAGALLHLSVDGPLAHTSTIPQLAIEIGYQQADVVMQLMHAAGFAKVWCVTDMSNIRRFVCARVMSDDAQHTMAAEKTT